MASNSLTRIIQIMPKIDPKEKQKIKNGYRVLSFFFKMIIPEVTRNKETAKHPMAEIRFEYILPVMCIIAPYY